MDTSDQTAFPSLSPVSQPTKSTAWGADSGPRIKATVRSQPMVSDSFTLSAIELAANKDGKPTSLGEVMKQVMLRFKVKIEASANQRTRQTTFHIKSESQKELDKAKRSLLALLSPVVCSRIAFSELLRNVDLGHRHPLCSCLYYSRHHWTQRLATIWSIEFKFLSFHHRCYSETSPRSNWSQSGYSSSGHCYIQRSSQWVSQRDCYTC